MCRRQARCQMNFLNSERMPRSTATAGGHREIKQPSLLPNTRKDKLVKLQVNLVEKTFRVGVLLSLPLILWQTAHTVVHAQARAQDKPFIVEYYYKAKWGHADEFIRLFRKNHYPVLKKEIELGRALQVTAEAPLYHGTEVERWDYRVRIVWKNVGVAHDDFDSAPLIKQLYPDQETFKREEQRRFEILLAHWDLPISVVNLDEK
jgi:hypothetical protein